MKNFKSHTLKRSYDGNCNENVSILHKFYFYIICIGSPSPPFRFLSFFIYFYYTQSWLFILRSLLFYSSVVLAPRENLAVSGDIFHSGRCYWNLVGRDQGYIELLPATKNYPASNVSTARNEKFPL